MSHEKPLPEITLDSEAFWRSASEGKLMLKVCTQCGAVMYYPRILCTSCMSTDLQWREASGSGIVHAFSVVYRPPGPAFAPDIPYIVALIELAEGPRVFSNIIGVLPGSVYVGMPVEARFDKMADGIGIPRFVKRRGEVT